jgi:hypothetical protein
MGGASSEPAQLEPQLLRSARHDDRIGSKVYCIRGRAVAMIWDSAARRKNLRLVGLRLAPVDGLDTPDKRHMLHRSIRTLEP